MGKKLTCINCGRPLTANHQCPPRLSRSLADAMLPASRSSLQGAIRQQVQREGPVNPATLALRSHILQLIEQHQWAVQAIFPTDHDDLPYPFAYTIGLSHAFDHPELMMVGLDPKLMQRLLNDAGRLIKTGKRFQSDERFDQLLVGLSVTFRTVSEANLASFHAARWYYEEHTQPPVQLASVGFLQIVWPDAAGLFPWEAGFDTKFRPIQPVLDHGLLE